MRFGVIGTGPAGLVATKYCLQNGYDCDVYEQTGSIGGTWVYTDLIGMDEDGIRIHTSMYKNLTTTFPKELMTYADFPYPETKSSRISAKKKFWNIYTRTQIDLL
ncbi:hypothetical protein FQR65_LT18649 [Abscondita terminalis]|nr:hypothetical protein FQR65_LT18649 [Abscondita terminalis]